MSNTFESFVERQSQFSSCRKITSAIRVMRECRYPHPIYRHYTSLNSLLGMIETGSMWLTLGKSSKLDDSQESKKYGTEEMWKRTFISCFVHDEEESAAMWGLYCPRDAQAVCISISNSVMKALGNSVSRLAAKKAFVPVNPQTNDGQSRNACVAHSEVIDIAYASVPKNTYSESNRGNFLSWDGCRTKRIASLKMDVKSEMLTGVLKDYEWNFEHETRIIVRLDKHCPHASRIAIPVPVEMFKGMSITFGPWLDNKAKYEQQIETAMRKKGIHNRIEIFPSTLSGALKNWECSKG